MTDIATNLNTIDGSLSDIKTAIVNKGVTPSGNITTFATAIDNIPSGGGGGGGYQLRRITDDNNNEIGTAFMEFEDTNGNKYDVVCLDAQYRNDLLQYCSSETSITDLALYNSSSNKWWYDNAKETATYNTQKILDYCTANGYTSSACTHCRSKSFTIGGITYYGQLPNMREVFEIWKSRTDIESMDTSSSSYSSLNFSTSREIISSTQITAKSNFLITAFGYITNEPKTISNFICPVLELPK